MSQGLYYFDDFYPNPMEVRSYALQGEFKSTTNQFTGTQFVSEKFPMKSVYGRLAHFIGEEFHPNPNQKGLFRSLTRKQYLSKENNVHIDRMGISCLICLNETYEEGIYSGLYRHRETGLAGIIDQKQIHQKATEMGMSEEQFIENVCADGFQMDLWEEIERVSYKFNRLIVFNSNFFHAAAAGFGDTLENAKLTQNFNFYPHDHFHRGN